MFKLRNLGYRTLSQEQEYYHKIENIVKSYFYIYLYIPRKHLFKDMNVLCFHHFKCDWHPFATTAIGFYCIATL